MTYDDYSFDVDKFWSNPELISQFKNIFLQIQSSKYGKKGARKEKLARDISFIFLRLDIIINPTRSSLYKEKKYLNFVSDILSGIKPAISNSYTPRGKELCVGLLAWMSMHHPEDVEKFYEIVNTVNGSEAECDQLVLRRPTYRGYVFPSEAEIELDGKNRKREPLNEVCIIFKDEDEKFTFDVISSLEKCNISVIRIPLYINIDTLIDDLNSIINQYEMLYVILIDDDLYNSVSSFGFNSIISNSFVEIFSNDKLISVFSGLSRKKILELMPILNNKYALNSDSGASVCVDSITRAMYKLKNGISDLRKFKASVNEKESGRSFLEDKLHNRVLQKAKHGNAIICMIDIDKTNQINKKYGDHVGDLVIKESNEIISNILKSRPHEFGQCGDDTFFFVLYDAEPVISDGEVFEHVDGIRRKIFHHRWNNVAFELKVTCSVGYAIRHANEEAIDAVVRAGIGMNEAKAKGGNQTCMGPSNLPYNHLSSTSRSTRLLFS